MSTARRGRGILEMGGFLTPFFVTSSGVVGIRPVTLGARYFSFELRDRKFEATPPGRELSIELKEQDMVRPQ